MIDHGHSFIIQSRQRPGNLSPDFGLFPAGRSVGVGGTNIRPDLRRSNALGKPLEIHQIDQAYNW